MTKDPPAKAQHTKHDDPFGLSKFSIRRGSIQVQLCLLTANAILITLTVKALTTDGTVMLALSVAGLATITAMTALIIRISIRTVQGEIWIRRMGMGDLEFRVEPKGNDEITKTMEALETLRQSSIRAIQLDRVQQLSKELETKNGELENVLVELRRTQDQIISQQKLAELGDLSAGVAHEIRNPLQFVKNFAETSKSIVTQVNAALERNRERLEPDDLEEVMELADDLKQNMDRIGQHCARANLIVTDMVNLRRSSGAEFRPVDINRLLTEQATLAYQAARVQDPDTNVDVRRELDPEAGEVDALPEDLGRVFINLVSNACHAVTTRAREQPEHDPGLTLTTSRNGSDVQIRIRDNGPG